MLGVSHVPEFYDPGLVAIYDAVNDYRPGTQPAFYLRQAREIGAQKVIDFGCGTGIIACELARAGFGVIGVDPSTAMLEVARSRPDAELIQWVHGDAGSLGRPNADLAIMAGHVAQFFLDDEAWHKALVALHGALRPGGRLAFESRNPEAREWERWNGAVRYVDDPAAGRIRCWTESHGERDGIVSFTSHRVLLASGEELTSAAELRLRTRDELASSLSESGFNVLQTFGDWDLRPPDGTTPELIFVAESTAG